MDEQVIEIVLAPAGDIKTLMERYLFTTAENEIFSELNASFMEDPPTNHVNTEALRESAFQWPVVKFVDNLLLKAIAVNASDINIRPTEKGGDVYYRVPAIPMIKGESVVIRVLDKSQGWSISMPCESRRKTTA